MEESTNATFTLCVQFFGIILTFTLGIIVKDTEEMPKTMALTQVNAGMTILCVFLVGGLLLLLYKTFWHQIHNENIYNDITENEENEMRSPLKSQMQGDGSVSDIHNGGFTDEEILAQGLDTDIDKTEIGTI